MGSEEREGDSFVKSLFFLAIGIVEGLKAELTKPALSFEEISLCIEVIFVEKQVQVILVKVSKRLK